jgi:hypothetical protein
MKPNVVIERTHPTVVTIRMTPKGSGWSQTFLLRSDAHHDSLHCQQDLEMKHLKEAKEMGAGILDFGDCFDVMGGKFDKRADPMSLRPELRYKEYFDAAVSYLANDYEPFAENWLLLSEGNHEMTVRERQETDIRERLAERLRQKGSPVLTGSYQGWIRFMFSAGNGQRMSYKMRYTHGYGGGGPVTRDVIQAHRQMAYLEADFLVSGHTHDSWALTARRETLLDSGRPVIKDVEIIKTGTYKDEYSCGSGWAATKGLPPKPLGAHWLTFRMAVGKKRYEVEFEVRRAK